MASNATSGPPLSPWQAPALPSVPAQTWVFGSKPATAAHSVAEWMRRYACWSTVVSTVLRASVRPQPAALGSST